MALLSLPTETGTREILISRHVKSSRRILPTYAGCLVDTASCTIFFPGDAKFRERNSRNTYEMVNVLGENCSVHVSMSVFPIVSFTKYRTGVLSLTVHRHHFELQQMYIFSFDAKCTKTLTMSECRLISHSLHNSWSCRRGALKGMVDRKHQHCHVLQLSTTATRTHQSCFFVMWQWSSLKNLAYIIWTALISNLSTRKGGTLE